MTDLSVRRTPYAGDATLTLLTVSGSVDMLGTPTLALEIATALTEAPRALIFDLTAVDFFSSAGLEMLASTHRRAGPSTAVMVVAASYAVTRPITASGVDALVPIFTSMEQALASSGRTMPGTERQA